MNMGENMASYKESIKFNEISVNPNNFRHTPVQTEAEAIKKNIDEDIDTFIALMESLINETRTVIVILFNDGNSVQVMDGNRRLSIFKIYQDKSLIPEGNQYNKIRELVSKNALEIPESFVADIYYKNHEDEQKLLNRLEELHVSTDTTKKKWNPLALYRASLKMNNIKYPWMKTLLFYYDNEDYIISITTGKVDIFRRFLDRKRQLKIQKDGKIGFKNDKLILDSIIKLIQDSIYTFSKDPFKTYYADTRTSTEEVTEIIDDIIEHHATQQDLKKQIQEKLLFDLETNKNDNNCQKLNDISAGSTIITVDEKINTSDNSSSKKVRKKKVSPDYLLHLLKISTKSEIDGTYKVGIEYILKELKILNKKNKYREMQLCTFFLIRSLLEQTLSYWIQKYHNNIFERVKGSNDQVKLGKLIKTTLNVIDNKEVVVFSKDIDKYFVMLFQQSEYKDFLNNMVHEPFLLNSDLNKLHSYTKAPLYTIFDFLLTEVLDS